MFPAPSSESFQGQRQPTQSGVRFSSVVTVPLVILVTRSHEFQSATYTFPELSMATPRGALNCASVTDPSWNPATPEPANVVTSPEERILRMTLLPLSATYRLRSRSIQIPVGFENFARTPTALLKPDVAPPANVVTTVF